MASHPKPCSLVVPEPPSGDTDSHDDAGDHLGEKNEEEEKKIEGAVTPRREKRQVTVTPLGSFGKCGPTSGRRLVEPEGFVDGPVPANKGAGGEEEGPEDGQAQAHAAARGVGAEHGQGGQHVEEQRGSAD